MTVKYSRALLNEMAGGRSVREALADFVLDAYEGVPPTNPEDARIGTKLARYTLSGGSVAVTDRSTPRVYKLVPATGSTAGYTINLNVTVEGVLTLHTYTILAADDSDQKVAVKVARMLNDIPQIQAICEGDAVNIWAQCRIPGLALTIADAALGGNSYACPATAKVAAVRVNSLQFSAPIAGVLSKPTGETWQDSSNDAGGVAGYFTICAPDDTGAIDSTYVKKRVQGTLAPVGGDGQIDPATITAAAVSTIASCSLTLPTSKT